MPKKRRAKPSHFFTQKGFLGLGLFVVIAAATLKSYSDFADFRSSHQRYLQTTLVNQLQNEYAELDYHLSSLRDYTFHIQNSRQEFRNLLQPLLNNFPSIHLVRQLSYVHGKFEELDAYERNPEHSLPAPHALLDKPPEASSVNSLYNQIQIREDRVYELLFYPMWKLESTSGKYLLQGGFLAEMNLSEFIEKVLNQSNIEHYVQLTLTKNGRHALQVSGNHPWPLYRFETPLTISHLDQTYQITITSGWFWEDIDWLSLFIFTLVIFLLYSLIYYLLTNLHQSTQSLILNQERFYQYFKNSHDAIIVMDENGAISFWNPQAEHILGYTEQEALNQPLRNLLLSEKLKPDLLMKKLKTPSDEPYEIAFLTKYFESIQCMVLVSEFRHKEKKETALFIEDVTGKRQQEAEIQQLAFYDPLTGLENRNYFAEQVKHHLSTPNQAFALMFIDLDGFKQVNDSLGHKAGDELLKIIALRIQHTIRTRQPDVHLCRFGGDEFALFTSFDNEKTPVTIAENILEQCKKTIKIEQDEIHISASIGIAFYPTHANNYDDLLRHADSAMYEAKSLGKNTFTIYDTALEKTLAERIMIEKSLRYAFMHNELKLYFQPQVDAQTLRVTGVEALLRWHHPTLGSVPPEKFIEIAEASGQILALGDWVIDAAIAQLKQWNKPPLDQLHIAINVSSQQLKNDGFAEMINEKMLNAKIPFQRLEIELTERSIMTNAKKTINMLQRIREKGFHISVDDFGTGYSSLSYLKKFPLSILKVDKSFIDGLPSDEDDSAISSAIIKLAHSLNMKVIAEGVETREQFDTLKTLGCDRVQGYYFSPALPPESLEDWLDKHYAASGITS